MAENTKDRLLAYGTLAGAVAVAIMSAVDYKTGRDLATNPHARPEAFTSTDGRSLEYRLQQQIDVINERDRELRDGLNSCQAQMREHLSWGRDLSIKQAQRDATQDAQIQELFRRLP